MRWEAALPGPGREGDVVTGVEWASLGVAIIGSVLASTYGTKVGDAVAGQPLPGGVASEVRNSLGFALETASRIGGPAGQALASTAKTAFVDGMHQGFLVGAALALVGAIVAAVWLPAHARRPTEELEAEYERERREAPEPVAAPVAGGG